MKEELNNLKNNALAQIIEAKDAKSLEELRISHLGRNGSVNKFFKEMGKLDPEERKNFGILLNDTKKTIEETINDKQRSFVDKSLNTKEWFDPSIPGIEPKTGNLHAQTKVLTRILEIFNYLGYQVADGPEVERDYYNFEVLNFPHDHPARDAQQTMFFDVSGTKFKPGELIPRTHTSAMQGRVMEKIKPPFKVVVPGKCFRYEQIDASHGVEFWHVEGFAVDKNIVFTDLLGTIEYLLTELFGKNTKIRFATTFFPFVEPGVDTYMMCSVCDGKGCSFCKRSGWSEIMPAGMIHPNVLKKSGIDPKNWQGFAFAIGLSRVVTLKYKINDLRILQTPDIRILKQF